MLGLSLRPFRRQTLPPPSDPAAERAVAERLLPGAREVLIAPGARGASESLDLVERLTPAARTEVICPPSAAADLIDLSSRTQAAVLAYETRLVTPGKPCRAPTAAGSPGTGASR